MTEGSQAWQWQRLMGPDDSSLYIHASNNAAAQGGPAICQHCREPRAFTGLNSTSGFKSQTLILETRTKNVVLLNSNF